LGGKLRFDLSTGPAYGLDSSTGAATRRCERSPNEPDRVTGATAFALEATNPQRDTPAGGAGDLFFGCFSKKIRRLSHLTLVLFLDDVFETHSNPNETFGVQILLLRASFRL